MLGDKHINMNNYLRFQSIQLQKLYHIIIKIININVE